MKRSSTKSKSAKTAMPQPKDVILEYTQADYEEQLAMGVAPDEAIKPGKYKGRRGGFLERHPEFKNEARQKLLQKVRKIRVNIMLDADIIEFFKAQAESPDTAKYQTQINTVLRKFVEGSLADSEELVKNKAFIRQVAVEVKSFMQ